ncbi:MAG TPA: preprotein translocase subunit YajC [Gemmatimonadaceae bacterium]|nr:preprotein translocase subunit YajC [Gemmatimonadaceae bacterium]
MARQIPLTKQLFMIPAYPALALLQSATNQLLGPIFMYGAIFAIFYFVLIRPGQKQRKAQDALIKQVKRGDEIVTTGGIIGEVIHIRETAAGEKSATTMEDRITIKSGESRLVVERGRIARVIRSAGAPASNEG